ncbi:hypothetical protein GHT09_014256 [Marmota monax]|uniref:Mucin-2 n=1 Tax=Marmota monax TaxID=9995 RepID=A0A834PLE1_MARMO|nr:hypothetical protein GHT09_014256 [Marmota monax]
MKTSRQRDGTKNRAIMDLPHGEPRLALVALNRAHNGRVCSTWGDFHYKTFDGDIFRFPGLCNYVFSAHCGAAYEDFNVQLRRSRAANTTTLSRVIMKLDGLVIELNESSVLVNGHPVQLPFSQSGVLMERSNGNLKVTARLGLVFMWDQDDDSLLLELDSKFANQTCGLCGDFNGIPVFSEFFSHDVRLTPIEFGNLQKMDGPTEQCRDPDPAPQNCSTGSGICEELLRGQLFSGCAALVDVSSYVEACRQDLCLCEQADLPSCICHTLAEYSRQCAHAGGLPQDWRGPDLCYQTCPLNMQHQECGSPCTDTCSNPQRSQLCEDHCVAGCFCPEGTVFDDIGQTGCVPMSQCSCLYNGTSYAPGANYSTDCTQCTCSGGRWSCQEVPCQGTCSVLGGSHLSTFDEKQYTVHGDCSYVLTKPCNDDAFTVLAELRRCGLTESETCLKGVELRLGGGPTAVVVKASGEVFVNQIYTQLPVSTANVTLFRPSTFFIIAQTNLGVQLAIQLVPTMQVFVRLAPELRGLTCGLCGNFNSIQADDFRTNSGVVEGTGAAFANTWKTQAACPNVKSSFEDPCSLSVENEKYAQHWCSQLTSPDGPFAQCHATVSPSTYYSNCMFDTCNCEKSEDCMCAALSSYVQACAAKGVLLRGWRAGVCTKPTTTCPKSMTYHYHISTCQPTCRALSEEDVTCHVSFVPVDGCACPEGMFLDASDKCVPAASCPCYHRGSMVPNGESLHDSGAVCTCTQGTLTCIGGPAPTQVCDAPMVYVDCHNATHGATGAGCQKSCHTLDMACYSPQCEPGCVCPPGLVADGSGGCIAAEDCPCMHNGASYRPGETIWAGCNTCTCENRMWRCTEEPCLATCALYGDGHFLTFDGQRYTFSGDCQYTLVQDHCGGNGSAKDAFRVVTENVPCGTTGTTCSKDIKIFLGSYELKLSSGKVEVVQKGAGQEPPYTIRQMGIYLVVDTDAGLVLLWDRRTSIFLRLSPEFKGRVCGLCGNFDGNALNDFTTRSQAVVSDVLEFGNSWKLSPSCPDAPVPKDPCTSNPYRKAWAQKQCSIIHSATFATCHAHVEPTMYYEACVGDACACDSGGDCECFCTAVAAYAQACHEAGVCVSWRTPDVCPLFCDYYNPQGECEWHFQPCGAPCMRTCRNPSGRCLHDLRGLEGCYPKCPPSAPIFDEDKMQCVDKCSTPTPPPPCRIHGKSYRPGATVPSDKNCYSWPITSSPRDSCLQDPEGALGRSLGEGPQLSGVVSAMMGRWLWVRVLDHGRHFSGAIPRIPQAQSTSSSLAPHPASTCVDWGVLKRAGPREAKFEVPGLGRDSTPGSGHGRGQAVLAPVPQPSFPLPSICTENGVHCAYDSGGKQPWPPGSGVWWGGSLPRLSHLTDGCCAPTACVCTYDGRHFHPGDVIYNTTDGMGSCISAHCRANGTVERRVFTCSPTTPRPPTTFSFSTSPHSKDNGGLAWLLLLEARFTPSSGQRWQPLGIRHGSGSLSPPSLPWEGASSRVSLWLTWNPQLLGELRPRLEASSTRQPDACGFCSGQAQGAEALLQPSFPTAFSSRQTTSVGSNPTQSTVHSVPVSTASSTATGTPLRTTPATSPVSPSAHCGEKCLWSPWLDVSRPGQGVDSGDFDTLQNLRDHGFRVCQVPRAVECRAEDAPEVPLQALGQHLECSPTAGLTCHNRDQASGLCRNYQIRVLCCSPLPCPTSSPPATHRITNTGASTSEGPSTASPVTTSGLGTVPTTSTTVSSTPVRTSFLKSNPTPRPKTTSGTSSASASPPGTSQVTDVPTTSGISPVSCLRESCTWTQWMDGSYPGPGRDSGDFDTFHNLRSEGYKFCERPTSVECRAQFFPNTPLAELGQQVTCNSEEGLICWNRDQLPPICYNYEIRIQCCELVDYCRNETIGTPKSIATHPKSLETSATTKTTVTTGSQATSTGHTIHPTPVHTSRGTSVGTKVTQPQTTDCQPQCTWTKWFDVDFPDPGPHGGDTETYNNILSKGERICLQPEDITRLECRAKNHPEVSIEALGQVVQCEPHMGLVCRNQEQRGPLGMCLNYEVRVLCCHTPNGCQTTVPVTHSSTSRETLTSQVQKTDSALTVSPSSMRQTSSTSVHTVSPSSTRETSSTSVHTVSPSSSGETSSTSVHTVSPSSTRETSSTSVHTVSPSSTRKTSSTSVHTVSPSYSGETSSTSVHTVSPSSTRETSSTSVHTTSSTSTVSPSSTRETSSTSVHTVSPSSMRKTSSTSVHTVSPSSTRETSSTSVHTVNPSSSGETSSTSVHTVSPSSTRETSSTSVHTVSPSSTRKTSSTPVHTVGPSSTRETSSTSVHTVSPSSTRETSSTSVHTVSPSSKQKTSSTSVHTVGPSSTRETRSTSVHTVSPSSTRETSSTSVYPVSPSSKQKTSSTSVHTVSPSSTRETSSTSVHTVSPSSKQKISSTPVHTVSPSSSGETSSTSVHTVSPSSKQKTSSTSVHTVSPSSTRKTSSTSVHTVSPSSSGETSSTSTTDCQPQCTWTKWFDVDFPDPGPHGGDTETYSNILSKGERICLQPEDITRLECRAENHPEVSIEALGQVVQCEPHMGLVCRNQEQRGPLGMCLNYEVRVLCCHTPNGCQTTGTPAWTVPPEPSSSVPSTSAVASPWSPSSAPSSTLPCFCSVLDQLYPAGSIIYRQRDLSGHCYYALCSQDCEVIKGVDHDCPSTTPPPTSVSSLSMSTPETGCPNVLPPREVSPPPAQQGPVATAEPPHPKSS